ncbi:MAG: serine/threonine-protein kinase [Myxococcota bacterium]
MDRFVVEATLGVGGMAAVHRVRHDELDTVHALKVPHEPDASRVAQLRREARLQARIRHPNVVAVNDVVYVDGVPALVMEYVAGPTLEELLRTMRVPRFEMELLVPGILAGVGALHEQGIVHRDLKPGNVLLARRDRRVVPKLLDFGLAEGPFVPFPDAHLAARDFGTPHYMAPEQLRDPNVVDARLDIYALGAVLYELATGVRAFPSDDPRVVMEAASRGHVTPVRKLAPDLPDRMAQAIEAALDPDPDARPATCAELWRRWAAPDAPTLSRAARPSLSWRGVWLGELERLGPAETSGVTWSPHEWSSTTTGWPSPVPAPRPPARWPLALVVAALLGVAGLVGAGTLLAAWATEAQTAPTLAPFD